MVCYNLNFSPLFWLSPWTFFWLFNVQQAAISSTKSLVIPSRCASHRREQIREPTMEITLCTAGEDPTLSLCHKLLHGSSFIFTWLCCFAEVEQSNHGCEVHTECVLSLWYFRHWHHTDILFQEFVLFFYHLTTCVKSWPCETVTVSFLHLNAICSCYTGKQAGKCTHTHRINSLLDLEGRTCRGHGFCSMNK